MFSVSRIHAPPSVRGAVAMVLLMACAVPAHAADAPPLQTSGPSTHDSIDRAIAHEKSHRSLAIAGMVVGGVAIIAGSVVSTVASVENRDDKDNGRPSSHNPYVGYAIGLGVGLPIEGLSAYLFAHAQHQLNLLNRQRLSVSYAPETHQPLLQIAFSF